MAYTHACTPTCIWYIYSRSCTQERITECTGISPGREPHGLVQVLKGTALPVGREGQFKPHRRSWLTRLSLFLTSRVLLFWIFVPQREPSPFLVLPPPVACNRRTGLLEHPHPPPLMSRGYTINKSQPLRLRLEKSPASVLPGHPKMTAAPGLPLSGSSPWVAGAGPALCPWRRFPGPSAGLLPRAIRCPRERREAVPSGRLFPPWLPPLNPAATHGWRGGAETRPWRTYPSQGTSPGPHTLQRGRQMALRAGARATRAEGRADQGRRWRRRRGRDRVARAVARAEGGARTATVGGEERCGRAVGAGEGRRAGAQAGLAVSHQHGHRHAARR